MSDPQVNAPEMSDPRINAPRWMFQLREGLSEAGFVLVKERWYEASFGNYVATFARRNMRVRAVKDRTEWRIDLWDDARPLSARYGVPDQTSPWVLIGVDAGVTEQAPAVRLDAVDEWRWLLDNLDKTEAMLADETVWRTIQQYDIQ